jgi:hypothetical protein
VWSFPEKIINQKIASCDSAAGVAALSNASVRLLHALHGRSARRATQCALRDVVSADGGQADAENDGGRVRISFVTLAP